MQELELLNRKRLKELDAVLKDRWESDFDISAYAVYLSSKSKLFLLHKDMAQIHLDELKVNSLGLYFGELIEGKMRLSIEGSQLVGPTAKASVIELDDDNSKRWMAGEDLDMDLEGGFYIVKNNLGDFCGCGKAAGSKLYGYVPKERRV